MDRRQRKTRSAIFDAFISLLNEKSFEKITVGEIIERADVGRATFYAHFETKDFLLKELCGELFCHVFDCMKGENEDHRHIFSCDAPDSVFLHLFQHLEKNDNHILDLLSGSNNELFLGYFKSGLVEIIATQTDFLEKYFPKEIPMNLTVNLIASIFIEVVSFWSEEEAGLSAEKMHRYFHAVVTGE